MKQILVATAALIASTAALFAQPAGTMPLATQRALVDQYCAGCHNDKLKSGGFSWSSIDLAHPEQAADRAEKAILKLRAGMMPPPGLPRPDAATIGNFATALEDNIDRAAALHPNPGRTALHRLNRTEYANSIRDLLDVDVDVGGLLPPDDMSHGFDNMADVLTISPTLMEGYIRAGGRIASIAVGDPTTGPSLITYKIPRVVNQMRHIEGTPFGTRGGISVAHNFPADGEYAFKVSFYISLDGNLFGQIQAKGQQLEVAVNGRKVALLDIKPELKLADGIRTPMIKIKAGPQRISASFIQNFDGPVQDDFMPPGESLADIGANVAGLTSLPHVQDLGIDGPYNITGVSETPSRRKIFTCHPASDQDDLPCAQKILSALGRQAFRRPLAASDIQDLMTFYKQGRGKGDPASPSEAQAFEDGIRLAVHALISEPEFVFRVERTPDNVAPGSNYRISDIELASRLSFFLWSSAPDDELLSLAAAGKLSEPATLEHEVRRMLASPESEALAANFAGHWLQLQNLKDIQPDVNLFPDFDKALGESMQRETLLFFDSIVRQDRSILDLLTGNYTFLDQRLAAHYGIAGVAGDKFRRVEMTDPNRHGLLGQASVLTLTSADTRTSPVSRGKWVMDVLLGAPPPPPPANVPPLKPNGEGARPLSIRELEEAHRADPQCASCHKMMDPIGFALENFDAVGAWRTRDNGAPIDPTGELYDGSKIDGPAALRKALLNHSDAFIRTFTQELLMYGLGRVLQTYDMPAVRAIDREAEAGDYRFSSLIMGIVKSTPFQMRRAEP